MPRRIVLTSRNIPQYLQEIQPYLDFKIEKIIFCREFDQYTNSNFLFEIKARTNRGNLSFFLKQARSFNKRAKRKGKLLRIDPKRIFGEVRMIRFLEKIWGPDYVPSIYYFDVQNRIIAMSDISQSSRLLIEEFNSNNVHPELGSQFGKLFGKLHSETFGIKEEFAGSRSWKYRMVWLLEDWYGQGIKKFVSEKLITAFYKDAKTSRCSVIWNDPVYRNIFVKKQGVSMVDFDHAMNYDPAVDNGIFLAHWVWMMLKGSNKLETDCRKFIKDYLKNYTQELNRKINQEEIKKILERTINWMAIYLVSRTDGPSGSYFKNYPKWEAKIRQTGIDLFLQKDTALILRIKNLIRIR